MKNHYFQSLEPLQQHAQKDLGAVIDQLNFNEQALIPVIAQDNDSKEVLMLAWMNREALDKTLSTGRVTYWSRSRQQLWVKGETSGNHQRLQSLHIDCDGDTILCHVEQTGAACHTGRPNCFYLKADPANGCISVTHSTPQSSTATPS